MRLLSLFGLISLLSFSAGASQFQNEKRAELRFRLTSDPATLDWNLAHTSHETYIIMNIMEGLVEEGSDLKPKPALAERWEISEDGKTYTFFLHSGVKWSDGRALKASDFVDSWARLLDPKTKSSYGNFLFDVENAPEFHSGKIKDISKVGIKALDDLRFQVKLSKRVPYFLHLPTFWVTFPIRKDLIRQYGEHWAEPGKMATVGPYLLKSWKKGDKISFEQNPEYFAKTQFKGAATIEAVIEPDDQKARSRFADGELDFLLDPTTDDLLLAKGKGHARVEQYPYLATYYLGMNAKTSVLKNASIRRALTAGIDREEIPPLLQGGQAVAHSWLPPGMEGHEPKRHFPITLLDAKSILAKAGYVEGKGFPKLSVGVEKFDGAESLARFLKRSFYENLGIAVDIHIGTPVEHQAALKQGKFGLFIGHWGADFPDAANFFEVFSSGSGTNYTGWRHGEYDRLMVEGRSVSDPAQRVAVYSKAEQILLDDEAVIVPIFYKRNAVVLGPRIKEFSISPLNYIFLKSVSVTGQNP